MNAELTRLRNDLQVEAVDGDAPGGKNSDGRYEILTGNYERKFSVDSVSGVVSCDVSFEQGSASVALSNPDAEQSVEDTIKKLGYTVSVDTGDQPMNPAS